eukprot:GHRQ01024849.1.p1 GENE.GHRQ01024849.1~~GHRQ01024849.1.p1  ORF type:complete len:162 (-),score=38.64 GHRQ01024849.1:299-784(-)
MISPEVAPSAMAVHPSNGRIMHAAAHRFARFMHTCATTCSCVGCLICKHSTCRSRTNQTPGIAQHCVTVWCALLSGLAVCPCSTDKCVIASAGCQVDMKALQKLLQARNVMFQHNHGKPMSCKAAAQLLSNTLYYKRFFPYYTFNLCAGLDEEGEWRVAAI